MDLHDLALKRLKAETRPLLPLSKEMKVPYATLREIKVGLAKDPRHSTVRKIAAYYFKNAA
jgi:hypothetical protein